MPDDLNQSIAENPIRRCPSCNRAEASYYRWSVFRPAVFRKPDQRECSINVWQGGNWRIDCGYCGFKRQILQSDEVRPTPDGFAELLLREIDKRNKEIRELMPVYAALYAQSIEGEE